MVLSNTESIAVFRARRSTCTATAGCNCRIVSAPSRTACSLKKTTSTGSANSRVNAQQLARASHTQQIGRGAEAAQIQSAKGSPRISAHRVSLSREPALFQLGLELDDVEAPARPIGFENLRQSASQMNVVFEHDGEARPAAKKHAPRLAVTEGDRRLGRRYRPHAGCASPDLDLQAGPKRRPSTAAMNSASTAAPASSFSIQARRSTLRWRLMT